MINLPSSSSSAASSSSTSSTSTASLDPSFHHQLHSMAPFHAHSSSTMPYLHSMADHPSVAGLQHRQLPPPMQQRSGLSAAVGADAEILGQMHQQAAAAAGIVSRTSMIGGMDFGSGGNYSGSCRSGDQHHESSHMAAVQSTSEHHHHHHLSRVYSNCNGAGSRPAPSEREIRGDGAGDQSTNMQNYAAGGGMSVQGRHKSSGIGGSNSMEFEDREGGYATNGSMVSGGSGSNSSSASGTSYGSGSGGGSSRYESQKRRDWNTFGQYLKNHQPPLAMAMCTGAHVLGFLRYLDQFGKTKVHTASCPYYGRPQPTASCGCPLRQAWGSLDALIGRLRAAFEENGGRPEANPFGARAVRLYLREVKETQAKARGIAYEKKKRRGSGGAAHRGGGSGASAAAPPNEPQQQQQQQRLPGH